MSFILDALKKLERHQADSVPGISTVHTTEMHKSAGRPKWPYLLLVALLLNAAILAALLRPQNQENQKAAELSTAAHDQNTATVESLNKKQDIMVTEPPPAAVRNEMRTPRAEKEEMPLKQVPMDSEPLAELSKEPDKSVQTDSVSEPKEPASPTQVTQEEQVASLDLNPSDEELESLRRIIKEEQSVSETENSGAVAVPSRSDRDGPARDIRELSELPPEIRKDIPEIKIVGHIYSGNPSARLANINGSLVHEGDAVTRTLKVKEITETGVIFHYKDLAFRVRAF